MRTSSWNGMLGAAAICAAAGVALGSGVQYQAGNIQYTNVNIASDAHAFTIFGEVDATGIWVAFNGYGPGPGFTPVELHGQHGVAFVEAFNPAESLFRITVTAQPGWAFRNMDWKLDALPPNDGTVAFTAFDTTGTPIPPVGTDSFFFGHNGQNPFHLHADADSPVAMLVIDSTVPIMDLKQVSVDLVQIPGPGAFVLAAAGLCSLRRRRR